jgi:hypothetical protein
METLTTYFSLVPKSKSIFFYNENHIKEFSLHADFVITLSLIFELYTENTTFLKQILSILLILAFLLPTSSKLWTFISFKINQEYIAQTLCVNKAKPQSNCHGSCHLNKQIKLAEAKEKEANQIPSVLTEKTEVVYFTFPNFGVNLIKREILLSKEELNAFYLMGKTPFFVHEIFHPPSFC